MKQEIKQRIEQIRRGEVPEEYKKTKAGIVPVEWNESRFKFMFSRINRKNSEGNTNVLTISAQYGLINQEDFFHKTIASDDKSNYFLLYRGEFAYNKSYSNGYPFGALKRLDNYDKGIVSPLYICFSANKENKCPDFYLHYFESGKLNSEIQAVAQEGARNHGLLNISIDDFFNSVILVPPLHEQKRIVAILSTQDKVIELYGKKIEQLQLLKKICLKKMFPKEGSFVPEVRFPSFTASWEQRKLGDICKRVTRKNLNNESDLPLTISSQEGLIDQRNFFNKVVAAVDMSNYYLLKKGEFAYNRSYSIGYDYGSIKRLNKYEQGCLSTLYICFSVNAHNVNDEYLECFFDSNQWYRDIMQICSEGARNHGLLNVDLKAFFDNVFIELPPTIAEQKDIANFFYGLNNLIALHHRRLDEEKRKKKALMQLLLTGIVRV